MRMEKYIYHYTNLDALRGILKQEEIDTSKGKKHESSLTFWGSRYDCMNDPQDFMFASNVVLPKIQKALEGRNDILEEHKEVNKGYPYIVSFTENRDDESMWKHYHAEVCLELDTKYISPSIEKEGIIKCFYGKCLYAKESEIDEKFIESWEKSQQYIDNIYSMAQHACVFIKRKAFERENEWRLYIADEKLPHIKLNGETYYTEQPQEVKVKCIRNRDIVFYKEFRIVPEALKGILVNETDWNRFHSVKKHIEILLESKGFCSKDIVIDQTERYPLTY